MVVYKLSWFPQQITRDVFKISILKGHNPQLKPIIH